MTAEAKTSELLQGKYTDALESNRSQLRPLNTTGQVPERELRVISEVIGNSGNGLRPAALVTETLKHEVAPILEAVDRSVAPAAKLTEKHEYRNAEAIEDNKYG